MNSTNRPRIWANRNQIRPNPGTIGRIRQKMACKIVNFERLKNREDNSDFDDFLTKTIASTRSSFFEIFASKKFSRWQKKFCDERTSERTSLIYLSYLGTPLPGYSFWSHTKECNVAQELPNVTQHKNCPSAVLVLSYICSS